MSLIDDFFNKQDKNLFNLEQPIIAHYIGKELHDDNYQQTWLANAGEITLAVSDEALRNRLEILMERNNAANMEDKLLACPPQSFISPNHETPLGLCACVGPIYGDSDCPCLMRDKGVKISLEHIAAQKEFGLNMALFTKVRFP